MTKTKKTTVHMREEIGGIQTRCVVISAFDVIGPGDLGPSEVISPVISARPRWSRPVIWARVLSPMWSCHNLTSPTSTAACAALIAGDLARWSRPVTDSRLQGPVSGTHSQMYRSDIAHLHMSRAPDNMRIWVKYACKNSKYSLIENLRSNITHKNY